MPKILRHDVIDKSMGALAESVASIITADDNDAAKADAMTKTFEQFGDYLKSNITTTLRKADEPRDDDDEQRTNTIDDDKKLSGKLRQMVAALITAAPSLSEEHAMHFLLHSPHGRRLAEHLNSISKTERQPPMTRSEELQSIAKDFVVIKMCKKISDDGDGHVVSANEISVLISEEARNAFPNETPAKAVAHYYDNNFEVRKALAITKDQQFAGSLVKSYATLKPTSTEVGSTLVSDDSAEAVKLLQEMATKQGRKF